MVWDLRGALLKKQEVECARLIEFEFRLRARSMRRLAEGLGLDPSDLARKTALLSDEAILKTLAEQHKLAPDDLAARWASTVRDVRAELITQFGDPTPHRLS